MDEIPVEFLVEPMLKLFHEDPREFVHFVLKNFVHLNKRIEELEKRKLKDGNNS